METIYRFAASFLRLSAVVAGLRLLGQFVDRLLDFSFLTTFFTFIRSVVQLFDFMIDTQVLFLLLGYAIFYQVGVLALRAFIIVASYFKTNN